jgi:hypothetical protein
VSLLLISMNLLSFSALSCAFKKDLTGFLINA